MNECPSPCFHRSSQPRLLLPQSTNSSGDKQHATDERERVRDGKMSEGCCLHEENLMVWEETFKRFGWEDKRRWRGWRGCSHTSLHIPPSLCSVILPCSIVALLIASRFSKGRSISSGSVPRLCLILFWSFVVARELIKEHLIAITCCQWKMSSGATVLRLTIDPCTHIQVAPKCLCFLQGADVNVGH